MVIVNDYLDSNQVLVAVVQTLHNVVRSFKGTISSRSTGHGIGMLVLD